MTNPRRDDPTQISLPPGAVGVLPRGDDMWEFDYPRLTLTIYDVFHGAIDAGGAGDRVYAEDRYRQLLSDYPEFIDVYHHLAMLLEEVGEEDEAYNLWQRAVGLSLEHVPEAVRSGAGTLPWLMLDNRPFLRAYQGLGLEILQRGQVEQALGMFLRLLDWNPQRQPGETGAGGRLLLQDGDAGGGTGDLWSVSWRRDGRTPIRPPAGAVPTRRRRSGP